MKVIAENRRAKFDYEIIDTVEAGILLTGAEAKSCRMGSVNLSGSYVTFLAGKPILKHTTISPYAFAKSEGYDPKRDRALLLSKAEIRKLAAAAAEKGFSVVPLAVNVGKYIKVVLGIGRGRKSFDKRHRIKEREIGRKIREGTEI